MVGEVGEGGEELLAVRFYGGEVYTDVLAEFGEGFAEVVGRCSKRRAVWDRYSRSGRSTWWWWL